MHKLIQTLEPVVATKPAITVERARVEHAGSNWAIYWAGRLASQPNEGIGLTESDMHAYFSDPHSGLTGRTISEWRDLIEDDSGNNAVYNAWLDSENDETPAGIARPNIQDDERWLSNVYVARWAQGRGVARALVDAAIDWHEGESFKLRAAEYNTSAIATYEKLGFIMNQDVEVGYHIGDIYVPQVEMTHPGS